MLKPVRDTRLRWTTLVLTAVAALLAVLTSPPGVAYAKPAPRHAAESGESSPVYSYDNAIRESVWVEAKTGADRTDRVAVDIIRPREAAEQGLKVPVIMDASPYYALADAGRGPEKQLKTYDSQGKPVQFPLFYDNYFVPRGYAVALVDITGTNRSDGCEDVGGQSEIQSGKAAIDWFNGRARAFDSRSGGNEVDADWSTGNVGMVGKSWDAAAANGVAATGVDGLKTIVPISGVSSWYGYFFYNGARHNTEGPEGQARYVETPERVAQCQDVHRKLIEGAPSDGSWTDLWSERDFVKDAGKIKASVFQVAGLQDLNVRTHHLNKWWDALAANGVERKIWLSTAGHTDPFEFRRAEWVSTLHRWFDHYLLGYDNGIDREPMADIERAPDQWTTDAVWPPSDTTATTLRPAAGSAAGVGKLGIETAPSGATAEFTDDPKLGEKDWAARIDQPTPSKAGFTTQPLTKDLRVSGHGTVTLRVAPSTNSATLSAVLVDLGPATIRDYSSGGGVTMLDEKDCWGSGNAGDTGCFKKAATNKAQVDYTIFSRAWADLGHHAGDQREVTPGQPYTITFDFGTADHVVPAGHRLGLIVAGTDNPLVEPATTTPKLTVDLAATSVDLPIVGGYSSFADATRGVLHQPSTANHPLRGAGTPTATRLK